ncbi:protease inhibitor [Streptomyces roseoverticillatus]|uniref:SSI family serine proteinase inhibitor n=1 Tax=Streptomyces roseoverticillatus TaxID=66429 RepID=UPI001F332253|nr:SSI family serine proteinase inhibitor [Streptomyces roseoverticillatus]MCF3101514.1 protease inhibitor [Streptomyces roseoverticillatus]
MSLPRTAVAASAAAAALLLLAAPQAAAGGKPGKHGRADGNGRIFLTVSGAQNTWIRGVQLSCPDADGHHPHAAEACTTLNKAKGDPGRVPGAEHRCTRQYDPVTATAEGEWNGRPVVWHRTFPNACALDAATGPVFRF